MGGFKAPRVGALSGLPASCQGGRGIDRARTLAACGTPESQGAHPGAGCTRGWGSSGLASGCWQRWDLPTHSPGQEEEGFFVRLLPEYPPKTSLCISFGLADRIYILQRYHLKEYFYFLHNYVKLDIFGTLLFKRG